MTAAASALLVDPIAHAHMLQLLEASLAAGRPRLPLLIAREAGQVVGVATAAPMVLLYAASPAAARVLADGVAHRVDAVRVVIAEPAAARLAYARMAEMRELPAPRAVPHEIQRCAQPPAPAVARRELLVRLATEADAPDLAHAVGGLVFTELGYDPRPRASYATTIRAQIARGQFFVACLPDDATPVAYVSTTIRNAHTIRMDNFVVPEALRGRGHGKAAASAFTRFFARATPWVSILVRTENAIARAVYAKTGFTTCGELLYLYCG